MFKTIAKWTLIGITAAVAPNVALLYGSLKFSGWIMDLTINADDE